jgi:DNA-directed RNA polymerase subunit RPC12/RpoP
VRRRAGYRCAQCGKAVAKGTGAVDHVLAGDPNSELQLLCDDCDRAKTLADLLAMRRRRLR